MFKDTFNGKKIVITGHTGFKGSWLASWLRLLGAEVTGISIGIPTTPSHFDAIKLSNNTEDHRIDICNFDLLKDKILESQPDFLFHLAAQPIVGQSYKNPIETYQTNVIGTLNVLESLRYLKNSCSAVLITSDKCYNNVEWEWGYRETDVLGGIDPYSASKGAAELIIRSHTESFFSSANSNIRIASARAGNVIGGGDWAINRIIPDCINSWSQSKIAQLRNPNATRPWQHVLEPLSGYLSLAQNLSERPDLHGEPFNFGPHGQQNHSVAQLVEEMSFYWDEVKWEDASIRTDAPHEATLLKLNCDKALHELHWHASMDFKDTVRMTSEWYKMYYDQPSKSRDITNTQIEDYMNISKIIGLEWTK